MKSNVWVVIPTYWGKNGTPEHPSDTGAFDHPTSIDGFETLGRSVENLVNFEEDFKLLILLAVTHKEYKVAAKKRVSEILKNYNCKKEIYLVTNDDLDLFNKDVATSPLNFKSYGAIRNVELFVPYICGADYVVAIDDDEIVNDKDYFKKVKKLISNKSIDTLSGVYRNLDNTYLLPKEESTDPNPFVQKINLINAVVEKAMNNGEQPHKSHVAFGGNMIIKRNVIERVCFDEEITRGEDFDYILNAQADNFNTYFYNDIPITHIPVKKPLNPGEVKCVSDIERHLYTYYKKQTFEKYINQDIYPEAFLKSDSDLIKYSIENYMRESKKSLEESTREVNLILQKVLSNTNLYSKQKYRWINFIETFQKNDKLLKFSLKWVTNSII